MRETERLVAIARALGDHAEVIRDDGTVVESGLGASAAQHALGARIIETLELAGEVTEGRYVGPPPPKLPPVLCTLVDDLRAARTPATQHLVDAAPWLSIGIDPSRPASTAKLVLDLVQSRDLALRTLVDVGSGPGFVTAALAPELPRTRFMLVDRPDTLEQAIRVLRGLRSRIDLCASDLMTSSLAIPPMDVALLSDVLHTLPAEAAFRLVATVRRSLIPGGMAIIAELPRASIVGAFYSMICALTQTDLDTYSSEQIAAWLTSAGFSDVEVFEHVETVTIVARNPQSNALAYLAE